MSKLRELDGLDEEILRPIVVILETSGHHDEDSGKVGEQDQEQSIPSPLSNGPASLREEPVVSEGSESLYSLRLLQLIASEISDSNLSKLVIPVAMISSLGRISNSLVPHGPTNSESSDHTQSPITNRATGRDVVDASAFVDPRRMMKYFEAGAVDVLTSPLLEDRVAALIAHAYRAHRDASHQQAAFLATKRLRKRSWVGVDEEQPYAYLREAMYVVICFISSRCSYLEYCSISPSVFTNMSRVSTLMNSICKPDMVMSVNEASGLLAPSIGRCNLTDNDRNSYILTQHQRNRVANAIGHWSFSAHDFMEDELVHASFLILKHAIDMPELEKWRLSDRKSRDDVFGSHNSLLSVAVDLTTFIIACRAAYNGFVLYHNFRHVVDVLQAVFFFLLQVGVLPSYAAHSTPVNEKKSLSSIAALLKPFDALTLLIAAIGHDVGHPGVNNAFLVALKAPLAQLYNDNSVLEAFHCAAYSQILRRYWNVAFNDSQMRQLLINTILATDMGVHFKYMNDLAELQRKLGKDGDTQNWSEADICKAKTLACGLLIKCADISNVVSS